MNTKPLLLPVSGNVFKNNVATTEQATTEQATTEQATTEQATTNKRRVKVKIEESSLVPSGIGKHFGTRLGNVSSCAYLESKVKRSNGRNFCDDGKGVRRLGGSAPSAFLSERGSAGSINSKLLSCLEGVTRFELEALCAAEDAKRPLDKLVAHLKGFCQQADKTGMRLRTTGVLEVLAANGWDWRKLPAVTIDGKVWDGTLFNKSSLLSSVIQSPMLWALKHKRTPSLAKILEREPD